MALTSKLFTQPINPALEDCAVKHSAHITPGAQGEEVGKIQSALMQLDNLTIDAGELAAKRYGPSTAAAVLAFKKRRRIINPAYQTSEDDIVGIRTMAALDTEMKRKEGGRGGSSISPDMQMINSADARRLSALMKTELELQRLKATFEPNPPDENDPVVKALQRQLFISLDSSFWDVVNKFLSLVQENKRTQSSFRIDKSDANFAHVDPNTNAPGDGVTVCGSFFAGGTNDNCRQEVITHEFFHFSVGLQHFYSTKQNSEAMRCPHHLARAVFDIALGQKLAPCSGSDGICK
jgi:hypothetical protein